MVSRVCWVLFALLACSRAPATSQPERPVSEPVQLQPTPLRVTVVPAGEGVEGVVRIEAGPGSKRFQGVWLERPDGERLVLAYRAYDWLKSLEGRAVRMTGETYVPKGQAVMATHYRVDTVWVLADASAVPILGFGPQTTLTGTLVKKTGPAGPASAGEPFLTFLTADGTEYLVEGAPAELAEGVPTQVQARAVAPSMQYTARRGGDWLWVLELGPGAVD